MYHGFTIAMAALNIEVAWHYVPWVVKLEYKITF